MTRKDLPNLKEVLLLSGQVRNFKYAQFQLCGLFDVTVNFRSGMNNAWDSTDPSVCAFWLFCHHVTYSRRRIYSCLLKNHHIRKVLKREAWFSICMIMNAKIVRGNRGGRILVVDGYRFQKHRSTNDAINWRCWRAECRSRLRTRLFDLDDETAHIDILFEERHVHTPDEVITQRAEFRETVVSMNRENPVCPIKRVYDAAVTQANRQGGGDRPHIESFNTLRSILHKAKSEEMPNIPHDVDDVTIDGPWAETWLHDRYLVYQDNNWGITVFATSDNLITLQQCHEIYMDATFRCCPAPYSQVFTVLGKFNGFTMPLVNILMANRTIGDYRQVLTAIRTAVRRVPHQTPLETTNGDLRF